MPHCVVEYSSTLESKISPSILVNAVHQAVVESALFDASHIKTRAMAYQHFQLAAEHKDFIHLTIRLHSGRTIKQKQQLTSNVMQHLEKLQLTDMVVTIETIDIDSESYAKQAFT